MGYKINDKLDVTVYASLTNLLKTLKVEIRQVTVINITGFNNGGL